MTDTDHEAAIEKALRELFRYLPLASYNGVEERILTVLRSLLAEVAPPQPAPEPTSGAAEEEYKYLGNFSAVDPAYSRGMQCDDCRVSWTGCWDNFQCPQCGGGELPSSKIGPLFAPAPTPTDVSAAAREAADREIQTFFYGGRVLPIGAHVQALLSTQRATDRQRIAELQDRIISLEMELAKINPNHRALAAITNAFHE